MAAPVNEFKKALANGFPQIGCWLGFADAYATEVMSVTGFDWLVVDGEHSPNDLRSIRDQLQVLEPSPSHAVVRLPVGETWMIKQALDIGAQTMLIPMIDTAEQAQEMVRACRYPPDGVRGAGATLGRASKFGTVADYAITANDQICLLVQVESVTALENLDDILAVEGIDGVFIGPADLAASMGFLGNSGAPEVLETIQTTISRIVASGKAAGILSPDLDRAKIYLSLGATFVAVGIDVRILVTAAQNIATKAKSLRP